MTHSLEIVVFVTLSSLLFDIFHFTLEGNNIFNVIGVAAAKKPIAVFAGDELDEEEEGLTDIRRVNKQLAARAASISKDAERVYESAKV